jgi:hypothetical protein
LLLLLLLPAALQQLLLLQAANPTPFKLSALTQCTVPALLLQLLLQERWWQRVLSAAAAAVAAVVATALFTHCYCTDVLYPLHIAHGCSITHSPAGVPASTVLAGLALPARRPSGREDSCKQH